MKVQELGRGKAIIELTNDELGWLSNALNEARECLDLWEFQTRMGAEPEEAEALLKQIGHLLQKMTRANS